MNIQILSDLHIERTGFVLPETNADLLLLAGNIGHGAGGLAWLQGQRRDRPVIYVPGACELAPAGFDVLDALVDAADTNVILLHDDAVVVDGVRFVGGLLWTDSSLLAEPEACFTPRPVVGSPFNAAYLHETLQITTPADSRQRHHQSRAQLRHRLATPFSGKTVLITHHALCSASLLPRFAGHMMTHALLPQLAPQLFDERRPDLWVHGNMQGPFDFIQAKTRQLCNPRVGVLTSASEGFNPGWGVEV